MPHNISVSTECVWPSKKLYQHCAVQSVDGGLACSLCKIGHLDRKLKHKRRSYFTGRVRTDAGSRSPKLGSQIEFLPLSHQFRNPHHLQCKRIRFIKYQVVLFHFLTIQNHPTLSSPSHPKSIIKHPKSSPRQLVEYGHHPLRDLLRSVGFAQFQPTFADFIRTHGDDLIKRSEKRIGFI